MISACKFDIRRKKLQRICENADETKKAYGAKMAHIIQIRVDQIKAARNVEYLSQFQIGGCHKLKGNRKGQYAMDLVQPYRLIFTQEDDNSVSVRIEEIVDYH